MCDWKEAQRIFCNQKVLEVRKLLEIVHLDLCLIEIPTHGGSKYSIMFIDDFSRKTWLYSLKQKSEAYDAFKMFKVFAERNKMDAKSKYSE